MPRAVARLPLQALQRFGSFLNCLSWKNSCSPAVNTKSDPQSTHFKTLSWNSILLPSTPCPSRAGRTNSHIDRGRRVTSSNTPRLRFVPCFVPGNPATIYMKPNYSYDCRPRNLSGPIRPTAILAEKYEGAAEGRMGNSGPEFQEPSRSAPCALSSCSACERRLPLRVSFRLVSGRKSDA